MTELETQIWNTVHNWCDAQLNEIPDQNRRYLMDEMKALVLSNRYKASCELNNEIMRYTFEEEFRLDRPPETVGETDSYFDLDNYKDWLEAQLIEARKQLALYNVVGLSGQCSGCEESTGETKLWCCNHCGKRIEDF